MNQHTTNDTINLLMSINETSACLIRQMQAVKDGKKAKITARGTDDLPDYERLLYTYNALQWITRMITDGQIETKDGGA